MDYFQCPTIEHASPLEGYKLLISWSNGEQTIFDASKHMLAPTAMPFRSKSMFDKVQVDPILLYWGDEEFIIMQDEIYEQSLPCT
jgi:hypothetical protein